MKTIGSFVSVKEANKKTKRRILLLAYGAAKVGKTFFALNSPDPVLVFDFDHGLEGVAEKFPKKDILVARYEVELPPKSKDKDGSEYLEQVRKLSTPVWDRFVSDWYQALRSEARTLVLDTASAAFNLGKLAYLGMVNKTTARDDPFGQKSGMLKQVFTSLITAAYNHDKNLILLAREKERWLDNQPSGEFDPDGSASAPYEVQMVVRLTKKTFAGKTVRRGTIMDSRLEGEFANGLIFSTAEGKDIITPLDFITIVSTVTGSDPAEWK